MRSLIVWYLSGVSRASALGLRYFWGSGGDHEVVVRELDENSIWASAQFSESVKHLRRGAASLDRLVPRVPGNPGPAGQVDRGTQVVSALHSFKFVKTDKKHCLDVLSVSLIDNRLGLFREDDKSDILK
jgi:hypothetical protein